MGVMISPEMLRAYGSEGVNLHYMYNGGAIQPHNKHRQLTLASGRACRKLFVKSFIDVSLAGPLGFFSLLSVWKWKPSGSVLG